MLAERYRTVRSFTTALTAPLCEEDCVVQSMPDASPTKWHLAHTTWFFETFILRAPNPSYRPFHPQFGFLFNSYYEAVGERHPRPERGMLTRPRLDRSSALPRARRRRDERAAGARRCDHRRDHAGASELGLHHEQQHQELILTDIQHAAFPKSAAPRVPRSRQGSAAARARWPRCSAGHRFRRGFGRWATTRLEHVRVRQRGAPASRVRRSFLARQPPGHQRRVPRVHARRRLREPGALAFGRMGRAPGASLGSAALLGGPSRTRASATSSRCTAFTARSRGPGLPRELLRGRRLRTLGGRPLADRVPNGRSRPARRPVTGNFVEEGALAPLRVRPARSAGIHRLSCSATFGNGPQSPYVAYPGFVPLPETSASTTASSCATRWCCAAARA